MRRTLKRRSAWRAHAGALPLLLALGSAASAEVWTDDSFGEPVHLEAVGGAYQITDLLGDYNENSTSLFHSFDRFSVETNMTAVFSATQTPDRIIARVTGGSLSMIDGTLRTSGGALGADVFLLNPSGVTFGPNAKLDLRGSFHVSTADRLRFTIGPDFDANSSEPGPALSVAAPSAFGFLSPAPALILFSQSSGLALPAGETFSAIGGPVLLAGNNRPGISVPSGRIQIAAVDHAADVPLDLATFEGAALAAAVADDEIPDVTFVQGFNLDVNGSFLGAGGPSGRVVIRGGTLALDASSISAAHRSAQDAAGPAIDVQMVNAVELASGARFLTQSSINQNGVNVGRAGDVVIATDRVRVRGAGTLIQTQSLGAGAGGALNVRAGQVELSEGGSLSTLAAGTGPGGAIVVEASEGLRAFAGGSVSSSTTAAGTGGRVAISAPHLGVTDGGQIVSTASAAGAGGALAIEADNVFVSNETDRATPSSIATIAVGSGAGGELTVDALAVEIVEGGAIATRTDGAGAGGDLVVRAEGSVRLIGMDAARRHAALTASTKENSTGPGGSLSITTAVIEALDGAQISTNTQGSGDGGSMSISASERVSIRGGANGNSFLSSDSRFVPEALELPGGSGDIVLSTGLLELRDGGRITANTDGDSDAGRIRITADDVVVAGVEPRNENPSVVQSRSNAANLAGSGDGGGIEIDATGDVTLSDRGELSSSTADTGDAGTTVVRAGGRILIEGGARIRALAEGSSTGDAGPITLTAGGGIELRDGASIEAAAQGFGVAGDVTIDAGPQLELSDSSISTLATFGTGGRITIRAGKIVRLRNSSLTTLVANGAGGGGDITIDPEFVVLDRSQLVARAVEGAGGNISIVAGTYFESPDSVVDASSELGIDGVVTVTPPDTDVTSGITTLPSVFLDATQLMRSACTAATAGSGSFVVSTHAGLPSSPDAPLAAFAGTVTAADIARAPAASLAAAQTALVDDTRLRGCPRAREEVL